MSKTFSTAKKEWDDAWEALRKAQIEQQRAKARVAKAEQAESEAWKTVYNM